MKATEFCDFFEFSLERENGYAYEDFYEGGYNYRATDNQGVFHDRLVNDVTELADKFDVLLQDYVQENIENAGFEPDMQKNYWEQALAWCDSNEDYKDTDIREVIACLIDPNLIEDDTEDEDTPQIFSVAMDMTLYFTIKANNEDQAIEWMGTHSIEELIADNASLNSKVEYEDRIIEEVDKDAVVDIDISKSY